MDSTHHPTADRDAEAARQERDTASTRSVTAVDPMVAHLLGLQRIAGNRAVNGLLQRYAAQRASAAASPAQSVQPIQRATGAALQRDPAKSGGAGKAAPAATVKATPTAATYTVTAKNLKEAAAAIRARAEAGETTWMPKYKTTHDDSGAVTGVTIDANIKVTMPSWAGAAKLTGAEKTRWDTFIAALQKHEDGHVALAQKKLKETGTSMIGKSEADAGTTFAQAVTDLQTDSDTYDDGNDHGRNEGVILDTEDPSPPTK